MPMHHWNPFGAEKRLERKQGFIGWFMLIGFILMTAFSVITVFLAFGNAIPGATEAFNIVKWLPVVGLVMYLIGLVYGIYSERTQLTGSRHVVRDVRVIARYAVSRDHRMVTDETEFEFLDRPKFFVKILSPGQGSVEYQCQPEVFFMCGEGMFGDIEVQGTWLGAFRPNMGLSQANVGQKF